MWYLYEHSYSYSSCCSGPLYVHNCSCWRCCHFTFFDGPIHYSHVLLLRRAFKSIESQFYVHTATIRTMYDSVLANLRVNMNLGQIVGLKVTLFVLISGIHLIFFSARSFSTVYSSHGWWPPSLRYPRRTIEDGGWLGCIWVIEWPNNWIPSVLPVSHSNCNVCLWTRYNKRHGPKYVLSIDVRTTLLLL